MKKKITILLAFALVGGLACADDQALSDMELKVETGVVNVLRDGDTIPVQGTLGIKPGDVIVTKQGTLASFALEGGSEERRGELQGSSKVLVRSTTSLEAQDGQLLMTVSEPTTVLVDSVTARSAGATFRIDRGFGSDRAGVYEGSVDLESPGQPRLRLDPLYQATTVAGDLPPVGRPYRLDEKDPWDDVLLTEVLSMEEELKLLARGFTPQLRGQRPSLDYFSALLDGGKVGFMKSYLRRRPIDLLIGFTLARNDDKKLDSAFKEAFDLFDDGARWGVAAKIMEIEPRPVLAQLERLILGTGVVTADGSGERADFSAAAAAGTSTEGSSTVASTDPNTGGTAPDNEPPPPDDDDPKPKPKPSEEPPEECSNSAECTINEVLGQDPDPSPSPTNEDKQGSLLDGLD